LTAQVKSCWVESLIGREKTVVSSALLRVIVRHRSGGCDGLLEVPAAVAVVALPPLLLLLVLLPLLLLLVLLPLLLPTFLALPPVEVIWTALSLLPLAALEGNTSLSLSTRLLPSLIMIDDDDDEEDDDEEDPSPELKRTLFSP
jgi:hypothetical protein